MAKNWQNLDLSILVFIFSPLPPQRKSFRSILLRSLQAGGKSWYKPNHGKLANEIPSRWHRPFSHTNPIFCTLGSKFNLLLVLEGQTSTKWYTDGSFYDANNFLGHS